VSGFGHPSRPGFYGVSFNPVIADKVGCLCDALIPGDDGYPSGCRAQVPQFIEDRCSPDDLRRLEQITAGAACSTASEAAALLENLELNDSLSFQWLRQFVYHGYYASRRVIAAMADRGYDYHGAPQPLGYVLPGETGLPSHGRGAYVRTEEVTRATP